jgi:MFS family permease
VSSALRIGPASPLADRTYRRLYVAQVIGLAGTGVTTIALGLLAYHLAGSGAGVILGWALALKMVAKVGLAPIIAAFAGLVPRKTLLVALNMAQAAVVLCMPFVTEVWQVYVLIFMLNSCAAGFTPALQATIPDVLPDERRYTRALSLSRVAYDLSELLGPALAALLLLIFDFEALFVLNGASFLVAAGLVSSVTLPAVLGKAVSDRTWSRITFGARRYLATPRLRGLLALNLAVASASAMVIVNTVVLVRDQLGAGSSAVAVALGAAGVGSLVTALLIPRVLDRVADRPVMLTGATLLAGGLLLATTITSFAFLVAVWFLLGIGQSLVQTPTGRLIQRSGGATERPALFAAQFSLSHACWLVTYPIAGVLGATLGMATIAAVLAGMAAAAALTAARLWRPSHLRRGATLAADPSRSERAIGPRPT